MNEWRTLFTNQFVEAQKNTVDLVSGLQELDEEISKIRPMLPILEQEVIPAEEAWLQKIKELKKPFNTWPLFGERVKLRMRYVGVTRLRWAGFSGRLYLMWLRFLILLELAWRNRIPLLILAGLIALYYLLPILTDLINSGVGG